MANTKERDFSTGLDNHGFRYYDPVIGRYVSRDPIGYGDGMNVHLHVKGNPINFIDPEGLRLKVEGDDERKKLDRLAYLRKWEKKPQFKLDTHEKAELKSLIKQEKTLREQWEKVAAFNKKTHAALKKLKKDKLSKQILGELETNEVEWLIKGRRWKSDKEWGEHRAENDVYKGLTEPNIDENAIPGGAGTGGTITIDEKSIAKAKKSNHARFEATLIHEALHAYDASKGQLDHHDIFQRKMDTWSSLTAWREYRATAAENQARRTLGVPLVKYYSIQELPPFITSKTNKIGNLKEFERQLAEFRSAAKKDRKKYGDWIWPFGHKRK